MVARVLQLLRHAKSSWDDPARGDRDRPLDERGRADAARVGARLRAAGAAPDLILHSTARRTRETAALLAAGLAPPPPLRGDDRLYLASGAGILALVRGLDDPPARIMVVAHNPGLRMAAAALAAVADPAAAERLRRKFPTAALAEFDVSGRWSDLDPAAVTAVRLAAKPSGA